jgi:hypothetical protein
MTSEKQIEANRENAKLSTGAQDTSKIRFNALKHGLAARNIKREEDLEEINILIDSLRDELKPSNVFEEIALNRIAVSLWKLNKITGIQSLEFYNSIVKAEESSAFDPPFISKKEKELCPEISHNGEALQRYEINAENSLHKAINLILKIRKEKLGSFL